MKACKSEHRMLIVTEAFIVVQTAEQAVDRLALLHNRATTALNQALKRILGGDTSGFSIRIMPDLVKGDSVMQVKAES